MNIPLMRIPPKECPFCHDMPILAKRSFYGMGVMVIMGIMNII